MRQPFAETTGWRLAWRRHERTLAVVWLILVALGMAGLAVTPLRVRLLDGLQAVARRWDDRWTDRIAYGEALLQRGDTAAAVGYFERLDAEFPARNVRHARDKQREKVLTLLARSYELAGKKGKTMATYERLVSFDPNNYYNFFLQGQAAERLLSGWALAPEARDAYDSVLVRFPSHLPSLRGYILYYMDRGEFIPVVEAYKKYLDAFLVQRVVVTLGDSSATVIVPVDGLPHEVVAVLPRPRGWSGDLKIATRGFAVGLEAASLDPAATVGQAERLLPMELSPAATSLDSMVAGPRGTLLPLGAEPALHLTVPPLHQPAAQLRLRLRLFKPVDKSLWAAVTKGYLNLLRYDEFKGADARTVVFPSEQSADAVLSRLDWAREGQELILDDRAD